MEAKENVAISFSLPEIQGALALKDALPHFEVSVQQFSIARATTDVIRNAQGGQRLIISEWPYAYTFAQGIDIYIQHVESRPSKKNPGRRFDFHLQCKCRRALLPLVEERLKSVGATDVTTNVERHETQMEVEHDGKKNQQTQRELTKGILL